MKQTFKKLVAKVNRTFVADCPRCHCQFFGHKKHATLIKLEIYYRIVCGNCAKEKDKYEDKAS